MKIFIGALFVIASFSGCLKSDSGFKCNYDACRVVAPASEIQSIQSYLSANSLVATQHCSGIFYAIDQQGSGPNPTVCNGVVFHYEGKLTNGNVFDKTTTTPLSIALSQLITGFQNGLPLLQVGGKMTLYIPPSLGYGSTQQGSIPANSILIFKIDLVAVQ